MREKLQVLADLQKVDLEIASLKKSGETYPKQLAELEKELGSAKSALEAERSKLTDLDRQKRTLEQNIADDKEKVKKWEQRLAEQRSTREYAALAREIDIAKKANQTMAEELTELTRTLAVQREVLKAKEVEHGGREQSIGGKVVDLRGKSTQAEGAVAALEGKRSAAASKADPNLLRRYETVKKKKLPVLVPVIAGTCQGCNMNVPPQLYNNLRTSLGTDICPSCNRIIYAAEALEAPAKP